MFRTISILGLGVVFLILAITAVLFSFRVVEDEDGNLMTVLIVVSLALAGVAGCTVYFARRQEREIFRRAQEAAAFEQPGGGTAERKAPGSPS